MIRSTSSGRQLDGIQGHDELNGLRQQHQGQMQQVLRDAVRASQPRKCEWRMGVPALQNAALAGVAVSVERKEADACDFAR